MDYGTDPLVSTMYARENQRAKESLAPAKMNMLDALRQRNKWNGQSLAELRDKAVTPSMLVAAGATWSDLHAKHGADALIEFGFDWETMRAAGFAPKHLASLTFAQLSRLGMTAPRVLECRPSATEVGAMPITAEQMKDLGWNEPLLRAVGIDMRSMMRFGYPLSAWRDVLGVTNFSALGFKDYAECARIGWTASDIALALPRKPAVAVAAASRRTDGRIQFI